MGVQVSITNENLVTSHFSCIKKILAGFFMEFCRTNASPMVATFRWVVNSCRRWFWWRGKIYKHYWKPSIFRYNVGSLHYALCKYPGTYAAEPTLYLLICVKRIFRYFNPREDSFYNGLIKKTVEWKLILYSDSDFWGHQAAVVTRKSRF